MYRAVDHAVCRTPVERGGGGRRGFVHGQLGTPLPPLIDPGVPRNTETGFSCTRVFPGSPETRTTRLAVTRVRYPKTSRFGTRWTTVRFRSNGTRPRACPPTVVGRPRHKWDNGAGPSRFVGEKTAVTAFGTGNISLLL